MAQWGWAINTRAYFHIVLLTAIVALASCRLRGAESGGVLVARTATPISTPLAIVPTAIPPGAEGNPIQMAVKPVEALSPTERQTAAEALTSLIQDKTGLAVEVVTVSRYAEALAALCDSGSGKVSISWLDGVAYTAATAENCGTPSLQVKRDTRREVETGASGQIIMNRRLGTTELGTIEGRTFCRLGSDDFYSWLLPLLVLKAQRIDLLTAPEALVDYEDFPTLIKAVADGDCDAAGIPEDAFDVYADDLPENVRDGIRVAATSIPFPYDILMYPLEVQLGVRLALNDTLLDIAQDRETAVTLQALLGQDELVRVEPKDFTELVDFMNSTGLDFAQLGG